VPTPSVPGRALAVALLALIMAARASATGVGLRWDACVADGGQINRSFACNTNVGNLFIVGSFAVDQTLTDVTRVAVSLELASASPALPAWWDWIGCRSDSHYETSAATTVCVPFFGSPGISGIFIGEHGPNTERIEIGSANFPPGSTVAAGIEYAVVAVRLNVLHTVGSGSCGGCATPVCIVVRSVSVSVQPYPYPGYPLVVTVLTQPLNGTDSNFATWQGGGSPVVGGAVGCPAATAAHRSVWGALKALYR